MSPGSELLTNVLEPNYRRSNKQICDSVVLRISLPRSLAHVGADVN